MFLTGGGILVGLLVWISVMGVIISGIGSVGTTTTAPPSLAPATTEPPAEETTTAPEPEPTTEQEPEVSSVDLLRADIKDELRP
jgi:uncharacterized membrane protein YagU involved in acid resistance